jgi:dynein heavy chain
LAAFLDLNFEVFRGLCLHIQKNLAAWKTYIQSSDPLTIKLEEPYQTKLDAFERMMIVKIFRSEKILFALSSYVEANVGRFYLESPNTTMEILYNDSNVATPIIFVLS